MTLMREWFTAAELAELALPGMPTTERAIQMRAKEYRWQLMCQRNGEPAARKRAGRGGGWEYHYSLLPWDASAALVRRFGTAPQAVEPPASKPVRSGGETASSGAWDWFDRLPDARKAKAKARLAAIQEVEALIAAHWTVHEAVTEIARRHKVGRSSLFEWRRLVDGVAAADRLPALAPRHVGRTAVVDCDPAAWEMLKADWLRPSRPSFMACYLRLEAAAAAHGWTIPSARTLQRKLEREIPAEVVTLARQGTDALKRMYPAQTRDRSGFTALEAVNADGHKWDVFVRWPDGTIGRPMMVAIQDLYSGKVVGWRVDRSENAHAVQLAFGDVFRDFGVPAAAWLDNGRGFASKWITGQQPTRYRFKVKEADPAGLLTQLGAQVHWTQPYAGQSKPIERAFRDMCDHIAKHPAFEGAYTGNKPDAKPENYRSKAVPLDDFLTVIAEGIAAHNARPGRRTQVCGGTLSFDEAFERSYATAPVAKATEEQLRMALMAAERVTARRPSGDIHLLGNRYWGEFLGRHLGRSLTVRFDPDDLHGGVEVYRLDGSYLGPAACIHAAGFADVDAAREHARKRKQFMRGNRAMLDALRGMTPDQVAALMPTTEAAPVPEAGVIRPVSMSKTPTIAPAPVTPAEAARRARLEAEMAAGPAAPRDERRDRFARALAIEAQAEPVETDAAWLARYRQTPEYRALKAMQEEFGGVAAG